VPIVPWVVELIEVELLLLLYVQATGSEFLLLLLELFESISGFD